MARGKCGKVIFWNELDAKISLARRIRQDKGEKRVQPCNICRGRVYHLTKQEQRSEPEGGNPAGIDRKSFPAIA